MLQPSTGSQPSAEGQHCLHEQDVGSLFLALLGLAHRGGKIPSTVHS